MDAAESPRTRLPDEREGRTVRLHIDAHTTEHPAGLTLYIRTGHDESGRLLEIFVDSEITHGEMIRGVLRGFARVFSIALQHGAPLDALLRGLRGTIFEPAGPVRAAPIGERGDEHRAYRATSLLDAMARYLDHRYPAGRLAGKEGES